jgi:hypothetical protein
MQQQTRVFEFSSGAQEGAAGTLRFDVTEVNRTALRMFKTKLQTRFDRMRASLQPSFPRACRCSQIPSAVNFGDDRGEVGHIGNKVWPAGN